MEFRLLGVLEVDEGGRLLRFRGPNECALLAALLLRAGEVVSRERLIEALWRGRPPPSAVHGLEVYVSRLRKLLDRDGIAIESRSGGYRIVVPAEQIDVHSFERHVQDGWRALTAGRAREADECLARALALWRGRPFSELAGDPEAELEAERLEELRISAIEGQIDAQLALGRHAELVGRLQPLVAGQPLREGLQRRLMLALYRSGRQAEALDVYRQARRRLVDELGVEPGTELEHLQQAILRHDPELDAPGREEPPTAGEPSAPRSAAAEERLPHEERKVVTVLFCDLVGSTAQAERLDPEDVHALLSRFHGHVRTELERFGGTVEKFIGDAVVAFFGAPAAHEDDPERAVRAALAIRAWVATEPDLDVRVAVETGEALVQLDADPAAGEGMVSGVVVNEAARLQAAAPVDGILVGEQTHRATERAIEYRQTAPVHAKGMLEPLAAWEAVRARVPLGDLPVRSWAAPLIGREHELALLVGAVERACEQERAQLVTLVGVPGIGKSRLIAELRAAVERSGRDVEWRQGRSLSYGDGVSYWALGEIVKAATNVLETDGAEDADAKLADAVARLGLEQTDASWIASHLRRLVGLATDARDGGGREETFAAWRRFVEALAAERPLVLVFEDLHWADDGLLDFVDELADRLSDVPVLVVASARPTLLARRPTWGGGKPNATTLSLSPLPEEQTAELVRALLKRSVLPAEVQSALLERAGGNPLYAEELVQIALERDGEELELPESVQAMIAARLDTLPAPDKALLQEAAVIGNVFWTGALRQAVGDETDMEERLHTLERREFVRRERRSAVAGESQYTFRHVLVRDVAYATIPRAARADGHRRAAEWIESLGRPGDHAEMLAYHYCSALELTEAAGGDAAPLRPLAARALRRAGDRVFALNGFATAIRYYDNAFVLGVDEETLPYLLYRLGAALNLAFDGRRLEVLEQARDALLAAGDVEQASEVCALLAEVWTGLGRPERRQQELERARALVRGRGASPAAARVLAQAARYAVLTNESEEGLRLARQALRMGERLHLDEVIVSALDSIGQARIDLGDREGGAADLARAIELGLATNNPDTPRTYSNLAIALDTGEDLERTRTLEHEGKGAADRLGNASASRLFSATLAWVDFRAGEWDRALEAADAFLAASAASGWHPWGVFAHLVRAHVLSARDDAAAAATLGELFRVARESGDPTALLFALLAAVPVYRQLGSEAEERAAAEELLPIVRGTKVAIGAVPFAMAVALEPLGLADAVRDMLVSVPGGAAHRIALAVAERDHLRAAELLAAGGDLTWEAFVRFRAAELLTEAGNAAEAEGQLERALSFYRTVRATRYLRAGEDLRAAASHAQLGLFATSSASPRCSR